MSINGYKPLGNAKGISFIEFQNHCYEVEVEASFFKECYGADADGNRGVWENCHEVENVIVYAENGNVIAEDEYSDCFPNHMLEDAIEIAVEDITD